MSDPLVDAVVPGLRVLHRTHGRGWVTEVADGKVRVSFREVEVSWIDLVRGLVPDAEELSFVVPIDAFLDTDPWSAAPDSYADRGEVLLDIVLGSGRSQETFLPGRRRVEFADVLAGIDRGDLEEVVGGAKATVDYAANVFLDRELVQKSTSRADTLDRYVKKLGLSLWAEEIYPSIAREIRYELDELLVRIAGEIAKSGDPADLRAAGKDLLDAIECRLLLLHGQSFTKALEARRAA